VSKAAFVDGASLHHMGIALGFPGISYSGLYEFLRTKIGSPGFTRKPVVVLSRTLPMNIGERAGSAGFKVIKTTRGHDDAALLQEISEIYPPAITEMVLVSADSDFGQRCLERAAWGMKIYWVATIEAGQYGQSMVGRKLRRWSEKKVDFIELRPHAREIFFR